MPSYDLIANHLIDNLSKQQELLKKSDFQSQIYLGEKYNDSITTVKKLIYAIDFGSYNFDKNDNMHVLLTTNYNISGDNLLCQLSTLYPYIGEIYCLADMLSYKENKDYNKLIDILNNALIEKDVMKLVDNIELLKSFIKDLKKYAKFSKLITVEQIVDTCKHWNDRENKGVEISIWLSIDKGRYFYNCCFVLKDEIYKEYNSSYDDYIEYKKLDLKFEKVNFNENKFK